VITVLFNRYTFLRVAASVLLILFIGCKIAIPTFSHVKLSGKEISIATEENDSDDEKKATPSPFEKDKDFASIYLNNAVNLIWHTLVVHSTAYSNNYQSSYYLTITIPPPDRA
jgi:general stress protein CsbA